MELGLKNINKSFQKKVIFKHLDFDFSNPAFYLLSGSSGSGKTTLLNIIAGFEDIDAGTILLPKEASFAYIFQSYELIEELTVLENISLPRALYKESIDEQLIEHLGLKDILNHYPSELSGGQKQRVGIARALQCNPDIIICDEPTESLDSQNKIKVLNLLKALSKNKIVIVSCHDTHLLKGYADNHYHIEDKQLHPIFQTHNQSTLKANHSKKKYDLKVINSHLKQIIEKRSLLNVSIISFLMMFIISMVALDSHLFMSSPSLNALNKTNIYVNTYNSPDIIKQLPGVYRPIVKFNPLIYNGKTYKVNIFPINQDNHALTGNEIIINTDLNKLLNKSKGDSLTLSYDILGSSYEIDFKIKDIVNEEVYGVPQLFYNYDTFNKELQTRNIDFLETSQYDYFIENANYYEFTFLEDNIETMYKKLETYQEISVYHSILTERFVYENQSTLYHLIFIIVECLTLVVTLFYIFYSINKDIQKDKVSLSLLHSLGIPIEILKKNYQQLKLKYFLIPVLISSVELILFYIFFTLFPYYLKTIVLLILLITLLYIITFKVKMHLFKENQISIILKNNEG